MRVDVVGPQTYANVSVEHPSIIATIQNLTKQGRNIEYIMQITGMPQEVVQRHARKVKEP